MSKKNAQIKKSTPFHEAMSELEQVVQQLEQDDANLEASLAAFERGIALARHCRQSLKEAEQRVQILLETEEGDALHDLNT